MSVGIPKLGDDGGDSGRLAIRRERLFEDWRSARERSRAYLSQLGVAEPERTALWRRGYDVSPPNGESLKAVEERVGPFLDALVARIRREHINVALSVHGNSMRAIRRYFEQMDIEEMVTHENPLGNDYALYVLR